MLRCGGDADGWLCCSGSGVDLSLVRAWGPSPSSQPRQPAPRGAGRPLSRASPRCAHSAAAVCGTPASVSMNSAAGQVWLSCLAAGKESPHILLCTDRVVLRPCRKTSRQRPISCSGRRRATRWRPCWERCRLAWLCRWPAGQPVCTLCVLCAPQRAAR